MSSSDSIVSTDLEINMGSSIVRVAEAPAKGDVSFQHFAENHLTLVCIRSAACARC